MRSVEFCPIATGVKPCAKATEAEPRIRATSVTDWAPGNHCPKPPLIITSRLLDSYWAKMPTQVFIL